MGGLAALALAVFFHRTIFSRDIFGARDVLRLYYPLKRYWADRVLAGELPDWFPYDGLGQPFVGMVTSATFHPANLLYLLLPLTTALKWNTLLCFPFALAGVYRLLRRQRLTPSASMLGGVTFCFCGYLVSITDNLLYLAAAATVPWAFWAADRLFEAPSVLRGSLAALLLSLVLFAGDSQSFVVCAAMILAVAGMRVGRANGRAIGVAALSLAALTGLICSLQLVPAWQVVSQSLAGTRTLEQATVWSTHPLRLIEILLGPIFAGGAGELSSAAVNRRLLESGMTTLWVSSLYVGWVPVLLGGVALFVHRRRAKTWVMAALLLAFLGLALGKHTGLYGLLFRLVPLWRPFRYPEKLMSYVLLGLSLAAAVGLHSLEVDASLRRKVAWVLAAVGALCLVAGGAEQWAGLASRGVFTSLWGGAPAPEAIARLGARFARSSFFSGVTTLIAAAIVGGVTHQRLRPGLLVTIVFACLYFNNEPQYLLIAPEVLERPTALARYLASPAVDAHLGGERVFRLKGNYRELSVEGLDRDEVQALSAAAALEPIVPALFGVEGANATLPATSSRVVALAQQERDWVFRNASVMGTRFFSISSEYSTEVVDTLGPVVASEPSLGFLLVRSRSTLPRAYFATPRCVENQAAAEAGLGSPGFAPGKEALVECGGRPIAEGAAAVGTVSVEAYAPERVRLRVNAQSPGVVVLNDAFYSGWTATVDEAPTPILPTNVAVRGVKVSSGAHLIEFTYRTPGLLTAAWLSGVALMGSLLAGLALEGVRRRRERAS